MILVVVTFAVEIVVAIAAEATMVSCGASKLAAASAVMEVAVAAGAMMMSTSCSLDLNNQWHLSASCFAAAGSQGAALADPSSDVDRD